MATDAGIHHDVALHPLRPRDASALLSALQPHIPYTSIRTLILVTAPDASGGQLCRLSAVLDAGGVFVSHAITRTTPNGPYLQESAIDLSDESEWDLEGDPVTDLSELVTSNAIPPALWNTIERVRIAAMSAHVGEHPAQGQPSSVELCVDRNGTGAIQLFFDGATPPEDSGADHHVWHHAPELDELKESLDPDSWWDRTVEDIHTWFRKVFTRES